ncbi:CPBP family intramembrane metalloprotease [Candidatus Nomurabacteria bacterium]|nr:CPBP family intramembrane metalloprotease [Candidatus Nomurabacteria bacterium]
MEQSSSAYSHDRNYPMLEIVYLFVAPVVLIYLGVIPYEWRIIVLLCITLLMVGIIRYQHWTAVQVGMEQSFASRKLFAWGLFTILAALGIILYAKKMGFEHINLFHWQESWRLILFFIPLSVLQEVAYRTFLTERLRHFSFSFWYRIFLNAALFTLLHIIYPYAAITLPIAFVGGILFAWLYERYPSLLLACIVHCVVNFVAVYFRLFS